MQAVDAKKGSRFKLVKTIGSWALVPGLGVPITKLVESHYNVSYVSSATSALWNWILIFGRWLARDVTLPFWIVLLLFGLTTVLLVPLLVLVYGRYFKSDAPDSTPLNSDQVRVFYAIGKSIQRGANITFSEIVPLAGLSRIATQNALEVLSDQQLITGVCDLLDYNFISLTREGREFFLDLESNAVKARI